MNPNALGKLANKVAVAIKKANKEKQEKVELAISDAAALTRSCAVLSRIIKLAESDAEIANGKERLSPEDSGKAQVWAIILQELDALDSSK